MTRRAKHWRRVAATCAITAWLASGCSLLNPRPDPTRYVVLASMRDLDGDAASATERAALDLGLGPIRLPEYLAGSELMVRASPTELRPSRVARWAEPMDEMVLRVLADDLVQLVQPQRLVAYPWYAADRPRWQIEIDVLRFEPAASGEATLVARWWLRDLEHDARSVAHESHITERASKNEPAQIAEAMSRALARLASAIADAVRAVGS